MIEKAADLQFFEHLSDNNAISSTQSAYRPKHSVETALVKVHDDLVTAVDGSKGVALVLLDLSAAFDTIDHSILLSGLESMGVTDTALAWENSYLTDRKQSIYINSTSSAQMELTYGVPQGSVKGPRDFIFYTRQISSIAELYGVSIHSYADDTQLYLTFDMNSPSEQEKAIRILEKCCAHISHWMKVNKLQLNEDKTEFLIVCSPRQRHKLVISTITIGGNTIMASKSARNLGVIFDDSLNMKAHISAITKTTNFYLRQVGKISRFLTKSATQTLIHALITSRLDVNNALLYGLPQNDLMRLQRVQNNAARIVSRISRQAHVKPVLRELHWLPILSRITFKVLLLTYKSLHGLAPGYLQNLLSTYVPDRSLRSKEQGLLSIPKTRLVTYGDRAWAKAAPLLWNALPAKIKNSENVDVFKARLKTHLFRVKF
jgi:hypothetical protein